MHFNWVTILVVSLVVNVVISMIFTIVPTCLGFSFALLGIAVPFLVHS